MFLRSVLVIAILTTALGCTSPVREEQIKVQASNDPLHQPRQILARYAAGQPLGSETTTFSGLVEKVRKSDPATADMLQAGFDDLQKSSVSARPAKAKELLEKIQPKAYPSAVENKS